MFFPVKADKFSGILRRYKNRGYPKIELLPSSTESGLPEENVLDFKNGESHWASPQDKGLDSYFVVRIVSGVLRITNYSIRSHNSDNYYMQAWTFEASNDNINYVELDDRPQNTDLKSSGIGQYPVNSENNYYQYFRIKQTIATIKGLANMRISGLDFYGEFLPFKLNSCRYSKNNNCHIFMLLINVILS